MRGAESAADAARNMANTFPEEKPPCVYTAPHHISPTPLRHRTPPHYSTQHLTSPQHRYTTAPGKVISHKCQRARRWGQGRLMKERVGETETQGRRSAEGETWMERARETEGDGKKKQWR